MTLSGNSLRQIVHTHRASVDQAAKLVAAFLRAAKVTDGAWWKVMAAYRWVYDSRHLQADCQGMGSAPEPYARQSSMGYLLPFFSGPGTLSPNSTVIGSAIFTRFISVPITQQTVSCTHQTTPSAPIGCIYMCACSEA